MPDAGEQCVVTAWPLGEDGRKLHAGTALFAADGELLALAKQVWIAPKCANSPTTRRQREQEAAVVVVGGEEVHDDALLDAGTRADLELLPHLADAPLAHDLDGCAVREGERLRDLAADQVRVAVARQLEHAPPGCEHARISITHDEAGLGRRVVILEQLVEESECAAPTLESLRGEAVVPVEVDRALLAVRADEVRHAGAG